MQIKQYEIRWRLADRVRLPLPNAGTAAIEEGKYDSDADFGRREGCALLAYKPRKYLKSNKTRAPVNEPDVVLTGSGCWTSWMSHGIKKMHYCRQ